MMALAVLAAAAAGWLWVWPRDGMRRLAASRGTAHGRRRGIHGWLWAGGFLGIPVAFLVDWAIGVCVGAIAMVTAWGWRRHRHRRTAMRERSEVVKSAQLLGGMVRLGLVPSAALRSAASQAPLLAEAAAVQAMGGDVGAVLRGSAEVPGREGLAEVARAWEVAERTGASMTATLDAVAERLAATETLRDTVEAELSAPRATGRLLAVLPVAGLALGYLVGGDPLGFLTGSVVGQLCLVAGVALACAGVVWTELLADRHGG